LSKIFNQLNNKIFYQVLIILSSFIFTFYSGYRGVFPLDSFLIFDGGYKILNNFLPFKDYWTISGPLLDYLQSIIFYLFKINWFSYVLHAALINTILALVAFFFFNSIGLKKYFALIYSLSISILAYPSAGTPFMDHHATILTLLSLMFLILAIKKDSNLYWLLIPILLGFSFLSKQIPAAFFVIYFFIILYCYLSINISKYLYSLKYSIYGSIIFLAVVFFFVILNEIPIESILNQYIFYPISIGEIRGGNLNFDFKNIFLQFKFIYISILPSILIGFILFKIKRKNLENQKDILILISILASFVIFIYSQLLTKNQILIFFLIPFYIGLSHYFLSKYYKKEYPIYFLIFILIISTLKFHLRFNVDKKFMELNNVDFKLALNAKKLDPKLNGLKWISPYFPNNPDEEIKLLFDAKNNIINENLNKIIISDYQILPFLTKSDKFAPNKWFDTLSVPKENNPFFVKYKQFFLEKLKMENIEVIFIVGADKSPFVKRFLQNNCFKEKKLNKITYRIDIRKCIN
tara:strand:- start:5747 stop:7309 length:1563 start_codon:yes stop_codon:yes gene_type:complete